MIIIPGQSGTYRHSQRRVTGLLAESGLISLAGPGPSGSAKPSRLCQRCFPPSPASPGSDCAQLPPGCCDSLARRSCTSFDSQRLTAHQRLMAHTNRRHMTGDQHGPIAGRATLLVRAVDAILGTHNPWHRAGTGIPGNLDLLRGPDSGPMNPIKIPTGRPDAPGFGGAEGASRERLTHLSMFEPRPACSMCPAFPAGMAAAPGLVLARRGGVD